MNTQVSDGFYSTLCNVNITIRDVNNHAPMFERVHFVTSIAENLPIGKYILDPQSIYCLLFVKDYLKLCLFSQEQVLKH